jgi:hypothetical protein
MGQCTFIKHTIGTVYSTLTSRLVSEAKLHSCLKRQPHEIFDLWFFHKSIVPRPLHNTLKYFRILFRIPGDICEYVLC